MNDLVQQLEVLKQSFTPTSKFSAKLTEVERCQMLALRHMGFSIGTVAQAFDVNRRTVTHVFNDNSPSYKSVRIARDKIGVKAFVEKYVNEDLIERIKKAAATAEAQESYAEHDAAGSSKPNRNASRCSGITLHRGPEHEFSHRIEVKWLEGEEGYEDGWYSRLLDVTGVDSESYFGDPGNGTHKTSARALSYAKGYCNDNY